MVVTVVLTLHSVTDIVDSPHSIRCDVHDGNYDDEEVYWIGIEDAYCKEMQYHRHWVMMVMMKRELDHRNFYCVVLRVEWEERKLVGIHSQIDQMHWNWKLVTM